MVCSIINTFLFYTIFKLLSFQNPQPLLPPQQVYYTNVFNKPVFSFYMFLKLGMFCIMHVFWIFYKSYQITYLCLLLSHGIFKVHL